jgi:hypothetical protein
MAAEQNDTKQVNNNFGSGGPATGLQHSVASGVSMAARTPRAAQIPSKPCTGGIPEPCKLSAFPHLSL